jgi:hypothetical protein
MKLKRRKRYWIYLWAKVSKVIDKFGCDNIVIYNTLYHRKPNLAGKGRKVS